MRKNSFFVKIIKLDDRAPTTNREYLRNHLLNGEEDRQRRFDGASSDNRMNQVHGNLEDRTPNRNREDLIVILETGTFVSKRLNLEEEGDARLH